LATIVLAHGAWSAAWAWKKMRPLVAAAGHQFFTPTYTGLGERAHLASPSNDLETHVQDVLGVLTCEDLHEVVLIGHSYGGMVATGVADRAPDTAEQCAEVLRIPTKKAPVHAPSYLDPPEVEAILAQPDRSTLEGQRDHALLSFLYNTGARIQEALELRPNAIRWESPACVRLYGKGRKERLCPLWPETVALLKALLKRQPRASGETLFVNRYGAPLGASGVRFKLAQYSAAAAKKAPSLGSKTVTPHSFRHATAVHLVAAGVDITVIRSWLGHVSLDTTNHYAQANLETKRKALERVGRAARAGKPPRWRRDHGILEWLDSL